MAAKPEAPITLGTTTRPAPLLALVDVLVAALLDLTTDVDSFAVVAVKPVDDPLGTGVDDPVEDAAGLPLICAATEALKVPVMPVRLFPSEVRTRRSQNLKRTQTWPRTLRRRHWLG